jgi:hypothetical protein
VEHPGTYLPVKEVACWGFAPGALGLIDRIEGSSRHHFRESCFGAGIKGFAFELSCFLRMSKKAVCSKKFSVGRNRAGRCVSLAAEALRSPAPTTRAPCEKSGITHTAPYSDRKSAPLQLRTRKGGEDLIPFLLDEYARVCSGELPDSVSKMACDYL